MTVNRIYQSRVVTLPLLLLTVMSLVLLPGCGNNDETTAPLLSNANGLPTWNPDNPTANPPVGPACVAGDADGDGSCDSVDPSPGNPDGDGDGILDGLDVTPTGAGSGGSGDHLSLPALMGIGLATIVGGSFVLNGIGAINGDCQKDLLTVQCVDLREETASMEFAKTKFGEKKSGMLTMGILADVNKEWIADWGLFSGKDFVAQVRYQYTYKNKLPSGLPAGEYNDTGFIAGGSGSDTYPLTTVVETIMDANGCGANGKLTPGSTGAEIAINGESFMCLEATSNQGFPLPVQEGEAKKFQIAYQTPTGGDDPTSKMLKLYPSPDDDSFVNLPPDLLRSGAVDLLAPLFGVYGPPGSALSKLSP